MFIIAFSKGNPCKQKQSIGIGNKSSSRWFFNEIANKCETFKYSGLGGNENNFLTEDACKTSCRGRILPFSKFLFIFCWFRLVFVNVCPTGEPAMQISGIPAVCEDGGQCPQGFWCHYGSTVETRMCCPNGKLYFFQCEFFDVINYFSNAKCMQLAIVHRARCRKFRQVVLR